MRTLRLFVCLIMSIAPLEAQHSDTQVYIAPAKAFVIELSQRRFESASKHFDAKMTEALPVKRLQETWDGLLLQAGSFREILKARAQEIHGYSTVFVTCAFIKTNLDVKVVFDNEGQIAGLFFVPSQTSATNPAWAVPTYVGLHRFNEQTLTVGSTKWPLPGVLTMPVGEGPFPGLVLVHGSGPSDADESIGNAKPFKDLAWGLSSCGIAVLRYSKRTFVHGGELRTKVPLFTVKDESIDDARAAVELLRNQPKVNAKRVYLLGHSLGGMLAPRIAAGDPGIVGIIVLAGPSRPLEQVLVEQMRYIGQSVHISRATALEQLQSAENAARQIEDPNLKPEDVIDFMGIRVPGSYWLDLRGYNPAESAAKLAIPILVVQGGRDYQVTQADFEGWKTRLAEHPNVSFRFYPKLNHLMMLWSERPVGVVDHGHVSAGVVRDIAEWIRRGYCVAPSKS